MLTTAKDVYVAFLDGIKKEYTGTVTIPVFERIWNIWAQPDWLNSNVSSKEGIELTQKQIDDLEMLRVVTTLSKVSTNAFNKPTNYFRLLNVKFSISYNSNECGLNGVSPMRRARIMRSDIKVYAEESSFRKPSLNTLYYEIIGGQIKMVDLIGNTGTANQMKLEYLRLPIDLSGITNSSNGVMENFTSYQKREILDLAIRTYLERVRDPRYQTVLNENNINNISKQ